MIIVQLFLVILAILGVVLAMDRGGLTAGVIMFMLSALGMIACNIYARLGRVITLLEVLEQQGRIVSSAARRQADERTYVGQEGESHQ